MFKKNRFSRLLLQHNVLFNLIN